MTSNYAQSPPKRHKTASAGTGQRKAMRHEGAAVSSNSPHSTPPLNGLRVPSFARDRQRQQKGAVRQPPSANGSLHAPANGYPVPKPVAQLQQKQRAAVQQRRRPTQPRKPSRLGLYALIGTIMVLVSLCGAITLGVGIVYANGILPGVRSLGVSLGGASPDEAANDLRRGWGTITVTDGERSVSISPTNLGLTLDSEATAQAAWQQGRGQGNPFSAILGGVEVSPVIMVDANALRIGSSDLAPEFEVPAVNAGVRLVNGRVEPTDPINGQTVDIEATVAHLQADIGAVLADGVLELVMRPVQPTVTDATPLVAEAERVLTSPLPIRAYDPIRDQWLDWSIEPAVWASWLTAAPDPNSPFGLSLSVDGNGLRSYLEQQGAALAPERYIDVDEAVAAVQQTFAANRTDAWVRVYHNDKQHVVQAGETIISIAWDYGVPYPWIQRANGGIEALSVGQTITIPSADNFLDFPVIPNKRIVVSISHQRVWIYENGAVKWEWIVSTGIQSSPTWPGIYQIISHEMNAYASNWDLWMPYFMGVYRPIPGADFVNGFHGFPTRGGSQLLWTNSLGTRVTYGCILVSNDNAQLLWDWAEEGVIVEIRA